MPKANAATQTCKEKGIVLIVVMRDDTKKPLSGLDTILQGPTQGRGATAANGVKQYEARVPGAYGFSVTFPQPQYKDWVVLPYGRDLSVSAGRTTIAEVFAYPTGALRVRVVEDHGSDGERPVKSASLSATGPQALQADRAPEGQHTFTKIRLGEYEVVASVSADDYEPSRATLKRAVPQGGEAEAVIKVVPKTWIKLRVHDVQSKADLPQYSAKLKPTAGNEVLARPGADGVLELKMSRKGQRNCALACLDVDDEDVFEFVEITQA
jgi:hypothetical protein